MSRPSPSQLWRLAIAVLGLALADVLLTTIGVLWFNAEEGNPLIVALAQHICLGSFDERVVLTVWLSKMALMAVVLLAVHFAVRSKPARDDRWMLIGLWISLTTYLGVVGTWGWYFIQL